MSKKEKSVAFQFYPRDYLSDINVEVMTLEEEGIYIRLLSYCWLQKRLPNDITILCQLAKGAAPEAVGRVVRTCFKVDGKNNQQLFNSRLELERKKQKDWATKSSDGGVKSGKARRAKHLNTEGWFNGGSTVVEPNTNSSSSSSSVSITPPVSPPLQGGARRQSKIQRRLAMIEASCRREEKSNHATA